jgi:hypothetical protein
MTPVASRADRRALLAVWRAPARQRNIRLGVRRIDGIELRGGHVARRGQR